MGDFPTDFYQLGWVHPLDKSSWGKMVGFVFTELEDLLKQTGLYQAVRAVQYSILQSSHHFYGVLERYNPLTGIFLPRLERWGSLFMSYTKSQG